MTQQEWALTLSRAVAVEVRRHRDRLKISAQGLADRCAELGYPIQRSVLANLENGRRENVTLAELLVLSKALEVPPLLLIFPVGETLTSEPLPGAERPTWASYTWATGQSPFPSNPKAGHEDHYDEHDDTDHSNWKNNSLPLMLWLEETTMIDEWYGLNNSMIDHGNKAAGHSDEEVKNLHLELVNRDEKMLHRVEADIKEIRAQIRDLGALVRPLPAWLSHIDPEKSGK